MLPKVSWTSTRAAGLMATPETVLEGWVVKTNWLGGPARMLKGRLVTEFSPWALATKV